LHRSSTSWAVEHQTRVKVHVRFALRDRITKYSRATETDFQVLFALRDCLPRNIASLFEDSHHARHLGVIERMLLLQLLFGSAPNEIIEEALNVDLFAIFALAHTGPR
jgi:hypothetical protein